MEASLSDPERMPYECVRVTKQVDVRCRPSSSERLPSDQGSSLQIDSRHSACLRDTNTDRQLGPTSTDRVDRDTIRHDPARIPEPLVHDLLSYI